MSEEREPFTTTLNLNAKCGRPQKHVPINKIAKMRMNGRGWGEIAYLTKIPKSTIYNKKNEIELEMDRLSKIYIIDLETTGLGETPDKPDLVVEVGIACVDLYNEEVKGVYEAVVQQALTEEQKNGWIFTHEGATLTPEDVSNGRPFRKVKDLMMKLLKGKNVTSYNQDFDFRRFLYKQPWGMDGLFVEAPDIMLSADTIPEITKKTHHDGEAHASCENSYRYLCPDDPAKINGTEEHRSKSDAIVEGHIILELYKRGAYFTEDE